MKETLDIDEEEFYERAFSRNIGLLTELDQTRLKNLKIGIPGMGGVGGVHFITLIRTGITKFKLADFDTFEVENFNRQYGAFFDSLKESKLQTMVQEAKRINPFLQLETYEEGIKDEIIDDFLAGLDIIIDGLDFFAISWRKKLYDRALEKGIYIISAGPFGFGCSMICFSPFEGMRFSKYFNFNEGDTDLLEQVKFAVGVSPNLEFFKTFVKSERLALKHQKTASLGMACQICAGMAAAEVIKIVTKRGKLRFAPFTQRFDPLLGKYYLNKAVFGNRGLLQQSKIWFVHKKFKNQKLHSAKEELTSLNLGHHNSSSSLPNNVFRELLEAAILAPSGDNSQHWEFSKDGDSIIIYQHPERGLFHYSIGGLAQFISYGALVENISIAASKYELEAKVDFRAEDIDSDLVAKVNLLESKKKQKDPLSDFYKFRHTNRKVFLNTSITKKNKAELELSIKDFKGVNLHFFEGENRKDTTSLAIEGDQSVWKIKELHEDLFRWVRYTNSAQDGLTLESLELKPHEAMAFRLTGSWESLKILKKLGFLNIVRQKSKSLMLSSPLHCMITVKEANLNNYFAAGRATERFWITANSLGLSLQPMTSAIMLLHHSSFSKTYGSKLSEAEDLKSFEAKWSKLINLEQEIPVMFFRVGHAKAPSHVCNRRKLQDFIRKSAL